MKALSAKALSAKALSATVLAAALFSAAALPASAAMTQGALTLAAPMAGATLSTGPVDMSLYYIRGEGKALNVVATYVSDAAPDQPRQIVMSLGDGDSVSFSLPGHLDTLYSFARHGDAVTVSSQPATSGHTGA